MITQGFFPTLIHAEDVKLNNQQLANDIIAWSKQDQEGIKKTNMHGWHSTTDMHTKPEYKQLVQELFKMQLKIFKAEWLAREPRIGNMWANINPPGGYNRPHIHPNSLFSGVYYVKTPPNCGKIVFTDPRPGVQTNMPIRVEGEPPTHLWREVHLDTVEGRIVMFPSWLWHSVEENKSNDIRISVSFNFIQDGF